MLMFAHTLIQRRADDPVVQRSVAALHGHADLDAGHRPMAVDDEPAAHGANRGRHQELAHKPLQWMPEQRGRTPNEADRQVFLTAHLPF